MFSLNGYKIKGTDLASVTLIIDSARTRVKGVQREEYHRLLARETEDIIDDVTLGHVQRPEKSVFETARDSLNIKVRNAERTGAPTEYNLAAACSVLTDGEDTYILLSTKSPALTEIFAETEGIENCVVADDGSPENAEREKKWNTLIEQRGGNTAANALNASLTGGVQINPSMLVFLPPKERAPLRAEHALMNRYLSLYSGGEIKPHNLARCIDSALLKMTEPDAQEELAGMTERLKAILPEITPELIGTAPAREEAPKDAPLEQKPMKAKKKKKQ
jgi:hypothetical protein